MDKKCPSCGNTDEFKPTLVNDEYICEECETEFSEVSQEAYTSPNYRLFCERVVTKMRANVNDAIIASAIGELSEGFINDGPEYAKDFIERLSGIATELYNDHKAGLREEYDFSAIMEGVERLIKLYEIQNPDDSTFNISDEEDQEEHENENEAGEGEHLEIERPSEIFGHQDQAQVDPVSMIDPNAPPAEKTEHLALATLKGNVENLKNTLALLDAAEQQERETDGMDRDRLGGEGAAHEEKEAEMMAKIQDAVAQLQSGIDGYMQGEVNAHYSAPEIRNKIDDISSSVSGGGAMDGSLMAQLKGQLQEVCEASMGMLSECGYPVTEDAQLVSQGAVDAQLQQSIDTNTQEMSNTVAEAVVGGQNVEADLLTPESPEPWDLPPEPDQDDHTHDNDESAQEYNDRQPRGYGDQADSFGHPMTDPNNSITDISSLGTPIQQHAPGAYFGDPGFEDENELPGEVDDIEDIPVGRFNEGDMVTYEGEDWNVESINENIATLKSMNGEVLEAPMDNLELSTNHDPDSQHEHGARAADNLEEIWNKMGNDIEGAPPIEGTDVHRMYDVNGFKREKRGLELETFGDETMPIAPIKPTSKVGQSSLERLKKGLKAGGAMPLPTGAHPNADPNDTSKTYGRGTSGGFGDVRYEEEELEVKPIAQPNSNVQI